MNEIRTEEEFFANHHAGAVIAITDTATGNKVHVLPCNSVKADYFRMKVIVGRNKNGRYFVCDSVEEAEGRFAARRCMCVGTGQPIRRDTGATRLASPAEPSMAIPECRVTVALESLASTALVSYFSTPGVLKASLAMGPLDMGVLLSPLELSNHLKQRGLGEFSADTIFLTISAGRLDVLADAGRGKQNRVVPIVEWGVDCVGLNTEANCREVLARTLRARGFATAYEFIDSPDTACCVALDEEPIRRVRTAPNQRDLLAIRDDPEQRVVWAVETKGHSGLESWDFWELFGQLSRLEAWASTVRQEASSAGRAVLVNVAIGIPDRRCQISATSCYTRELSRLRRYLDEPDTIPHIAQKTMAHFVDWWVRWADPSAANSGPNVLLVRGIGDVLGAPS